MSVESEAARRGLVALSREDGARYLIGRTDDPFTAATCWHRDGRLVVLETSKSVLDASDAAKAIELTAKIVSRSAMVPRAS